MGWSIINPFASFGVRTVDVELVGGGGARGGDDGSYAGIAGGNGAIVRFRALLPVGTVLTLVVGGGAPDYTPTTGNSSALPGPAGGYSSGKGASAQGGRGGKPGGAGTSGIGGGGGQASVIHIDNAVWAGAGGGPGGGGGSGLRPALAGDTTPGGGSGDRDYGGIFEPRKYGGDAWILDGVIDGGGGGGGGGGATEPGAGGSAGQDSAANATRGRPGTSLTPAGATTFGASNNNSGRGLGGTAFHGVGPAYADGGTHGRITLWLDGVMQQHDYTGADVTVTIT